MEPRGQLLGKKKTAQPLVGFERQAWTIKRWSQEIDLSIPTVWVMVKDGRVPSVKIGGKKVNQDLAARLHGRVCRRRGCRVMALKRCIQTRSARQRNLRRAIEIT